MDQFDEKLLHLTDIMEYALVHKRDSSLQKIAQGEQVLLLETITQMLRITIIDLSY
jgi:hypothetical protein